jgi:hypothetical protein
MNFEHTDISARIILLRAGYGLARSSWFRTLEQIRSAPQVG